MFFCRPIFSPSCILYPRIATRVYSQNNSVVKSRYIDEQIEYIKTVAEKCNQDWNSVKKSVLSKQGSVNHKNIDAIMLKRMISIKNYDTALSFSHYLKSNCEELSLGTINGILSLYHEIGKINNLSKDQQQYILDTYKTLGAKYDILEYNTGEKLLHALCTINEWEKALTVLNDIHVSTVPTHSAYSTLIATLFKLNKKKKALEIIEESIKYKRPLLENAYEAWINYIVRKYKNKDIVYKYLEEIFSHVAINCTVIPVGTANKLKDLYISMDWNAQFVKLRKSDGHCSSCKDTLDCIPLTNEEFNTLQQNVKDKLIVGSDLFLKTSPDELKRFLNFVEETAPYDIVLDGLNISYTVANCPHYDKLKLLNNVVDYFLSQNKKVLLLGRKHMMRWHIKTMQQIINKTDSFFTENISQDDPYFITAAILSGRQTDILSKDLLRGHTYLLKNETLRHIFKRWQWQHQWMVFPSNPKRPIIQPPLKFTPCAQKKGTTWHLPFERDIQTATSLINDGTPDLFSWLCLNQIK